MMQAGRFPAAHRMTLGFPKLGGPLVMQPTVHTGISQPALDCPVRIEALEPRQGSGVLATAVYTKLSFCLSSV